MRHIVVGQICRYLLGILFITPALLSANELEDIVISSKTETTSSSEVSSHTTITENDIEKSQPLSTLSLLKQYSGIDYSETSFGSGESSVFIRGSEARHVVILIDGVEVYDPTGVTRSFNLNNIDPSQIERVEILKGSQSVLYGSNAIAGVISITTKKGSAKNSISIEAGHKNKISTTQTLVSSDKFLLSATAYYSQSRPLNVSRNGGEEDYSLSRGASLSAIYDLSKKWELQSIIKYNSNFDLVDASDLLTGLPVDSGDDYAKVKHLVFSQKAKYQISNTESLSFNLGHNHTQRENRSTGTDYLYSGTTGSLEASYLNKKSSYSFLFGFKNTHETFLSRTLSQRYFQSHDLFAKYIKPLSSYTFSTGSRLTHAREYGAHLIYDLGIKKNITRALSVNGIHSTGFKSPNLNALYGESGANNELKPEFSRNFELGVEQKNNSDIYGLTIFQNEVNQFIDYIGSKYTNTDTNIIRGFELAYTKKLHKLQLQTSIMGVNHSLSTGKRPLRRADKTFKTSIDYRFSAKSNLSVYYSYIGHRLGRSDKEMPAYDLLDIQYLHSINTHQLSVGIKNLFDRDYEVARGYETLGLQLNASYKYRY